MTQEQNSNKERSPNRVLVLKPIDGRPKDVTGMVDPRLFKGENKLHGIMDESSCLWRLKYEQGMVPPELRQSFTSFKLARQHAERYFNARNVEVVEVKD